MVDVAAIQDNLVPHARFVEVRDRRRRMMTAFAALSTAISRRHDADDAVVCTDDSEPPAEVRRALRSNVDTRRTGPYIGGNHTLFAF